MKVDDMVDQLLAVARTAHPDVEFTVMLDRAQALLLPVHGQQLPTGPGTFITQHVYDGVGVEAFDMENAVAHIVSLVPVDKPGVTAPTYYGDLKTDQITSGAFPQQGQA